LNDNNVVDSALSYGDRTYKTVLIGEQTWMAENLNYAVEGSKCYNEDEANCDKYGRLYDWNTAQSVCPKDWHLPNTVEWNRLINADKHKFSVFLGGCGSPDGDFYSIGDNGYWWSASVDKDTNAYAIFIRNNIENIRKSQAEKDYLFSVRCVKNTSTNYGEALHGDLTMSNIIAIISFGAALAFLVFLLIDRKDQETIERRMDTNYFIVCHRKAGIMSLLCLVFGLFMCIVSVDYTTIASIISFLFFLSVILLFRWKIIVNGNQITFTPYIGKTKTFTFSDIIGAERKVAWYVRGSPEYIKVYFRTEDRQSSISVPENNLCYYTFISRLEDDGYSF